MITLSASARFFDPDDAPADGPGASFLLGDPDGTARVYSCLLGPAGGEDLEPGAAGQVHVELPMLTCFAVPDQPIPLWRGTVVGDVRDVTVLPEGDCEPGHAGTRLGPQSRQ